MAVRSFVMVGAHSDPDSFHDYLYTQLKTYDHLHIEAIEEFNELAKRRGNQPQHFEFAVKEIHRDAGFLNVQNIETGDWIKVRVDNDAIRFDIID